MPLSNNHKSFFSLLLLPAVLWLFFNFSTNWHYHISPDGEIIRHSHPYQQNNTQGNNNPLPFQSHEHSALEYLCLDQYSKAAGFEPANELFNLHRALPLIAEFPGQKVLIIQGRHFSQNPLRAPPFIS